MANEPEEGAKPGNPYRRISTDVAVPLYFFAIIFNALSCIPGVNVPVDFIGQPVMMILFAINRVNVFSVKNAITFIVGFFADLLPFAPGYLVETAIVIWFTRQEDKGGIIGTALKTAELAGGLAKGKPGEESLPGTGDAGSHQNTNALQGGQEHGRGNQTSDVDGVRQPNSAGGMATRPSDVGGVRQNDRQIVAANDNSANVNDTGALASRGMEKPVDFGDRRRAV